MITSISDDTRLQQAFELMCQVFDDDGRKDLAVDIKESSCYISFTGTGFVFSMEVMPDYEGCRSKVMTWDDVFSDLLDPQNDDDEDALRNLVFARNKLRRTLKKVLDEIKRRGKP